MPDHLQYVFLARELDPDILSSPFEVQTNWYVITGAQSSGKTTLIDLLAEKGFLTAPEAAREHFESEMAKGRAMEEILEDGATLERCLKDIQERIEHNLHATDVTFLDRALPDCLTFYRVFGIDPNDILRECKRHQYASVFILDRLPIYRDGLRIEDDALAIFLDEWLPRDYGALGYQVVRVPVLPPQERLDFILKQLSEES